MYNVAVWLIILAVLTVVGVGIFSLGRASALREEQERGFYPLPDQTKDTE
jgi:hypothetical protein